jgi:hypothetical protein
VGFVQGMWVPDMSKDVMSIVSWERRFARPVVAHRACENVQRIYRATYGIQNMQCVNNVSNELAHRNASRHCDATPVYLDRPGCQLPSS